ncbi:MULTISPECIES: DNA alkylation repair protein [Eisenbergiella]
MRKSTAAREKNMPPSSGKKNNTAHSNDITDIKEQLSLLAEPAYRDFSSSLLPGTEHILGVRLPALRKIARKLAKENWLENLARCTQDSFEEIMLQGFIIGYAKAPLPDILEQIAAFLPKINNWSVCDSFCITLKAAGENPAEFWDFLQPCILSGEEFTVRFAIVMLLDYYITPEYIDRLFPIFDGISHEGYYVKMAVAWAVSMCYVKFPEKTESYLGRCRLDDFTYNKSLQKITESLSVDKETKKRIRAMKRL